MYVHLSCACACAMQGFSYTDSIVDQLTIQRDFPPKKRLHRDLAITLDMALYGELFNIGDGK